MKKWMGCLVILLLLRAPFQINQWYHQWLEKQHREMVSLVNDGDQQQLAKRFAAGRDVNEVLPEQTGLVLKERPRHGGTLLQAAVVNGSPEMVRFLIEQGANVNAPYHGRSRPTLFLAIQMNKLFKDDATQQMRQLDITRILVENGATCNAESVLLEVIHMDDPAVLEVLLEMYTPTEKLRENQDIIKAALDDIPIQNSVTAKLKTLL